jgi:hypothetical protein
MSSVVGGLVVLGLLVYVMARALGFGGRRNSFRSRKARSRARSLSSSNGLLILAAVNLAALGLTLSEIGSTTKLASGALGLIVVLALLGGLFLLVAEHSLGEALVGVIGFGAALASAGLHYGASGVLVILVFAMLLVWFLGLIRGLVP